MFFNTFHLFDPSSFLFFIFVFPLFGIFLLLFIPNSAFSQLHLVALFTSLITFVSSLFLWLQFDKLSFGFQFLTTLFRLPFVNLTVSLGLDAISLFFVLLTTFLTPLCLLLSRNSIKSFLKEYLLCFLLLEWLLIATFSVLDLLLFYIFFESILMPMLIIIGVWGSRERKIGAAYQFFLYTLFGSVFFLLAILAIYFDTGTTDIHILLTTFFSFDRQLFLWFAFFASFAVKIPMVPVHTWLPEAHVEAPTAGSVILAGVLLKLGGYGFLRFSLPMFPEASLFFKPLIYTSSVLAILYVSLTTLRQVDFKKIIAYSSVSHMAFVTLGLFSFNLQALEGSILFMLSHGLVSSALFMCVGVLYDRHKTRLIKYFSGLLHVMPFFVSLFFLFTLANLGFPSTSGFIGEFLVLLGLFQSNKFVAFLSSFGMIFGASYSIWLWTRTCCGNLKIFFISSYADLNFREFILFFPLLFLTFFFGLYPDLLLDTLHMSVKSFPFF
jgi:proton-translocating NADH-quinone oxidoreductase chain M